ncbi:sugar ABC transporter permease [Paenibacillus sp. HB172176]|uniref:carbohydrate ABC transporter permease n=1 Tax=Paenibacillus sp. HB172176 TaxID=2493690 RepID=UPI00143AD822|nr:sugar ABC transporter permease [Paenibacillus sp. HB172176]
MNAPTDKVRHFRTKSKTAAENQFGFLLALPAMLLFTAVILYPFLKSVYYSFTDESLLRPITEWVNVDNYSNFLTSSYFADTLWNTLQFVVITTFIPFIIAFAWSIVLVQGFRGEKWLRTLTLYCWILPSASIGLLWKWLFNANYGIINHILQNLGFLSGKINFLGDDSTAMMAVCVAMIWHSFPWMMAFLLGGLHSVPQDQIEAVRIDGGGNWSVLKTVVLPHMNQIVIVILILSLINRFQHFDLLWVMTEGGPAHSTTTFSVEVYHQAFQSFEIGKAAAIGMIWVVLLSVLIFFYMRTIKDHD